MYSLLKCSNQTSIPDWTMRTSDAPYMETLLLSKNGGEEPAWAHLPAWKTSP